MQAAASTAPVAALTAGRPQKRGLKIQYTQYSVQFSVSSIPPSAWVTQSKAERRQSSPLAVTRHPRRKGENIPLQQVLNNCHTKGHAQLVSYSFWRDRNYPGAVLPGQLPAFQPLGHVCVCVVEGGEHYKSVRANAGTISSCILRTRCVSGIV